MYIKFRLMLSKSASIAISVVALIIFVGLAYEVTGHSSSSTSVSISGSMTVKPDLTPPLQIKANNTTYPVYFLTPGTKSIELNFTLNSTTDPVYVYDIAPLNKNAYLWQNITYFNTTGNYLEITNATQAPQIYSVTLYVNTSLISSMEPDTPYADTILFISAGGTSSYFVILLMVPGEGPL